MNKKTFPWFALGMGLLLGVILLRGTTLNEQSNTEIPLLALLIMSEFGFFMTIAGAYFGIKQLSSSQKKLMIITTAISNILLALAFTWLGIALWPEVIAG